MAYDKLWFTERKNKVSSRVLSLSIFQGPEIQSNALKIR